MIRTTFLRRRSAHPPAPREREEHKWTHFVRAPLWGLAPSVARAAGYIVTLDGSERLPECPSCGAEEFVTGLDVQHRAHPAGLRAHLHGRHRDGRALCRSWTTRLAEARERVDQPGDYVVYEECGQLRIVPLTREWTRVGRSLAADVRFDDPTVSRRHALIVRQPDGVRLLDDRSLNGVFVNGTRVDGRTLSDGDEIVVGRYHLLFLSVPAVEAGAARPASRTPACIRRQRPAGHPPALGWLGPPEPSPRPSHPADAGVPLGPRAGVPARSMGPAGGRPAASAGGA